MIGSRSRRAIVERLEALRSREGFPTLKAFHAEVVERSGEDFSYPAVRNYHDPHPKTGRFPPVDYLEAVSRVFDMPLAVLIRGQSDEGAAAVGSVAAEAAIGPANFRDHLTPRLTKAILEGIGFSQYSESPYVPSWAGPMAEALMESGWNESAIVAALAGPIEAFALDVTALEGTVLRDYILAMVPVLLSLSAESKRQVERLYADVVGLSEEEAAKHKEGFYEFYQRQSARRRAFFKPRSTETQPTHHSQ